jgi:hypothetical protein
MTLQKHYKRNHGVNGSCIQFDSDGFDAKGSPPATVPLVTMPTSQYTPHPTSPAELSPYDQQYSASVEHPQVWSVPSPVYYAQAPVGAVLCQDPNCPYTVAGHHPPPTLDPIHSSHSGPIPRAYEQHYVSTLPPHSTAHYEPPADVMRYAPDSGYLATPHDLALRRSSSTSAMEWTTYRPIELAPQHPPSIGMAQDGHYFPSPASIGSTSTQMGMHPGLRRSFSDDGPSRFISRIAAPSLVERAMSGRVDRLLR